MKKTLLINPSGEDPSSMGGFGTLFTPIPPLGIASIGAFLVLNNLPVQLIDQFASKQSNLEIARVIKENKFDIVGISCLTAAFSNVLNLIFSIRKLNTNCFIVLGNIHATYFHKELVKEDIANAVLRGEGEDSMVALVKALNSNKSLKSVPNCTWKSKNGDLKINPNAKEPVDLNSMPVPAWHLLDLKKYKTVPLLGVNEVSIHVQASRGCANNCMFCSQEIMNSKVRYRSINSVISEIEYIYEHYNIKYFIFTDANFPYNKKSGMEFANILIKKGLNKKVKWISETRVDKVSFPMLKRLKESGLEFLMFGFESGSQKILKQNGKKFSLKQAKDAAKWAKEANIRTLGLFMLGLYGDTQKTCRETINLALELDIDFAKFNITIPYPGSPLFDIWKTSIEKMPDFKQFNSWYKHKPDKLIYVPEKMKSSELSSLQIEAMLKFWVRPKQIIRTIRGGAVSLDNIFKGAYALISNYFSSR